MTKAKAKRWSVRFELAPENDEDVLIHDHLGKLAVDGKAAAWIRETLLNAVIKSQTWKTPIGSTPVSGNGGKSVNVANQQRAQIENADDSANDTRYTPMDSIA